VEHHINARLQQAEQVGVSEQLALVDRSMHLRRFDARSVVKRVDATRRRDAV
jgi:hypothetical protein